jgi:signal transduction histidine kinase
MSFFQLKQFLGPKSIRNAFSVYKYIALATILLLLIWIALDTYKSFLKEKKLEAENTSLRIESDLIASLEYSESVMIYINKQLSISGSNLPKIISILKSFNKIDENNNSITKILSISMFSWVDKNKLLIANSELGKIANPIDVSSRDYIPYTIEAPWKIHIGKPTMGAVSHQFIIPIGVGATDIYGKYIGSIIAGIEISNLVKKLTRNVISPDLDFLILDKNNNLVLESENSNLSNQINSSGILDKKTISGFSFLHPKQHYIISTSTNKYSYQILAGYKNSFLIKEFLLKLAPYLVEFFLIIIFFIYLLNFLRNSLITPLSQLSRAANLISQDKDEEAKALLYHGKIQEINKLSNQLKAIQDYKIHLIHAKKSQNNFFANMSHELRTPLIGSLSYAELLHRQYYGELNEGYAKLAAVMLRSGRHLLSLIDELLSFSKLNSGKATCQKQTLNLINEIKEAVDIMSISAQKDNITILVDESKSYILLKADKSMLMRMLLNIIANAIKFSHDSGLIKIEAEISRNHEIVIKVIDQGVGINPKQIPEILEEYGQARDSYKNYNKQGHGLGLPITQKLILLHGGRLEIKSAVEKGTEVSLIFPQDSLAY